MTIDDVMKHFGSGYRFTKETGISYTTLRNWRGYGFIPITMQIRLEKMTNGALKAVKG
jgi:hypothetical protein